MAPSAKAGGGGKSRSGAAAAGAAQNATQRTVQTRSQKAGLQVRQHCIFRSEKPSQAH